MTTNKALTVSWMWFFFETNIILLEFAIISDVESFNHSQAKTIKHDSLPANAKRKSVAPRKESTTEEKHYTAFELEMEAKTAEYFQMNCDLCLHQFESWNETRFHYLDRHNILKPFLRCCNRKFFLRSRIIEHITWHVDPSAFQYVSNRYLFLNLRIEWLEESFLFLVAPNAQRNSMRKEHWLPTHYAIWKMKNGALNAISVTNDFHVNTFWIGI